MKKISDKNIFGIGVYSVLFSLVLIMCSCANSSSNKTVGKDKCAMISLNISSAVDYASGFKKTVDEQRAILSDEVKNWTFRGKVVNIERFISLRVKSNNTPTFFGREYMPPFRISSESGDSIEVTISHPNIYPDYDAIRIGDTASKAENTDYVVISDKRFELVP